MRYERSESDWGLFSAFGGFFVSLIVGSVVVVLLSAYAFIRRERMAQVSLLISLPCLCFALWAGFGFISHGMRQDRERTANELFQDHRDRLISVPGVLRDEEWPNDDSPRGRALRSVLWNSEGSFSEEDFLHLANQHPSWLETMFYHEDCPLVLLSEGFNSYKLRSDRLPLSASFRETLMNPNSPLKFVEEVSTWTSLSESDRWSVDRILKAKSQKQPKEQDSIE